METGRIAHLQLIQGVVNRMAQNSFIMKGWAVTLISAILIAAHEMGGWEYLLIALLPALIFWGFDAYYLRQEKLFRCLYDHVRLQSEEDWKADPHTLNTNIFKAKEEGWLKTCFSPIVATLYLSILFVIIIVATFSANHQNFKKEDETKWLGRYSLVFITKQTTGEHQ